MYSKPLENSSVQFQWKVWGSARITKFKRRIFYFIFRGRMSSWGLLCVMIPSLASVPHCIMYEGICILYLAQLAGLPVAVVGRNSLYLLFIALALWPHGLSIELALTTHHQIQHSSAQTCPAAAAGISSLSSIGNKEKTMGWWQWIPRVWNYIQRQLQTKKIKRNLSSQPARLGGSEAAPDWDVAECSGGIVGLN